MDLTSLTNVKAYLGITAAVQDTVITSLISRESALVRAYCGQEFTPTTQTKRIDGTGSDTMYLPGSPIVSVANLSIRGYDVAASEDGIKPGYIIDKNKLVLLPGLFGLTIATAFDRFPMGHSNVLCTWTSGYEFTENTAVPTGTGNDRYYSPTGDGGIVVADHGVSYTANGAVLACVPVNQHPTVGQYFFSSGTYTFDANEQGALITMHYYTVPGPVEQACIEMVGLDLKQRDNLGVQSKSLAGETVSYTTKGMTPSAMELLAPYKRVAYV